MAWAMTANSLQACLKPWQNMWATSSLSHFPLVLVFDPSAKRTAIGKEAIQLATFSDYCTTSAIIP